MVFLDSGFFIAYRNAKDNFHEHAKEILAKILSGEILRPLTCDYVLDEVVTRTRDKAGPGLAAEIGKEILNSKSWNVQYVSKASISKCVAECERVEQNDLSFTDQIVAAMAIDYAQKTVITTDGRAIPYFKKKGLAILRLMTNDEYQEKKEAYMRSTR